MNEYYKIYNDTTIYYYKINKGKKIRISKNEYNKQNGLFPFKKIYYINLKKSIERNTHMKKIIDDNDLTDITERVEGIDGKNLDLKSFYPKIITIKSKNLILGNPIYRRFGCDMTHGGLGIALSFKKTWEKINKTHELSLILEDDVIYDKKMKDKIIKNIKDLPEEWDILYLGIHNYNKIMKSSVIKYNKYFSQILPGTIIFGLFAYVINPKSVKKLLKVFPLGNQIDSDISLMRQLNRYIVNKELIKSPPSESPSRKFNSDIQDVDNLKMYR